MRYLIGIALNLFYRWRMRKLGVSETYIRLAFNYLSELDLSDWTYLKEPHLAIKAWGNEVHIRSLEDWVEAEHVTCLDDDDCVYQCVIKEGIGRRVYVDEWRKETREVILEFGAVHETHWHEVYRSGRWIRSTKFIEYLKLLYGEGPKDAVKSKAEGIPGNAPTSGDATEA